MTRTYPTTEDGRRESRPPQNHYGDRPLRHRTCLNGKLVFGADMLTSDNALTLDCTIRDISEGGARVTLGNHQPLPLELYLIVVRDCAVHRAQLVWRKYPARGFKFLKTYALDATLPDEMKFLRHLCSALNGGLGGVEQ